MKSGMSNFFFLWIGESRVLESGIQLKESATANTSTVSNTGTLEYQQFHSFIQSISFTTGLFEGIRIVFNLQRLVATFVFF